MPKKKELKISADERQNIILKLIEDGLASTQEDICEALKAKKIFVTQSTVSRDLRWIGAIKTTNDDDEIIYRSPIDEKKSEVQIGFAAHVLEVRSNEQLIVVFTAPGSASLVARHLDLHRERLNILGTIAGDDTIFVSPLSCKEIGKVLKKIEAEFKLSSS